jgi:hypothetical protein
MDRVPPSRNYRNRARRNSPLSDLDRKGRKLRALETQKLLRPAKRDAAASAQTSIDKDRQVALGELVKAIGEFRKFTAQPLTLRGSDYANAVQELNKAIDRADLLLR